MSDSLTDISSPIVGGPLEDDTSAPVRTTLDESLGATAAQAWHDLPLQAMSRTNLRTMGQTAFDPDAPIQPGTGFDFDQGTQTAPDDANKAAKDAGATLTPFSHPVGANSLQSMIDDNLASQKRADVISRSAAGIIATPARFAVGALVSLADPLNDTAMMIPGAPEAWAARAIEEAGGGILARTGVRAGVGAVQGAAGMAALQPLAAAQASADHEDYTWGEAMRQVAFGAFGGAGLGAVHGALSHAAPETTEALAKASLAKVMNDDPRGVDVQGILDFGEATAAADRLEGWQRKQVAIDAERARLEAATSPGPDEAALNRGQAIDSTTNELARLREEADYQRASREAPDQTHFDALDRANEAMPRDDSLAGFNRRFAEAAPGMDARLKLGAEREEANGPLDTHQAQLNYINANLRRVLPTLDMRTAMEANRARILKDNPTLDQQRSVSQEQGLRIAAERTQERLEKMKAEDAALQAKEEAARQSADRPTRIRQFQIDGTEQTIQSMMEREVRRAAYKMTVDLQPGEAATIAREVRTAGPGEVRDTIASHLNALAKRSLHDDVQAAVTAHEAAPATFAIGKLRAEAQGAASGMASRAQNPTDPELVQTQRAAAQTIDTAPKLEGIDTSKDTAEASAMLADKKAEYDGLVASGELAEHPSLADEGKEHEDYGKAVDAYGKTCAFGG